MPDVTVMRLDEMDAIYGGSFVRARGSLGVTSFGMQVENLPPNHQDYPMRKILPGADGVQLLCLGGTPGQAFEVQGWSEPGGPIPQVPTDS